MQGSTSHHSHRSVSGVAYAAAAYLCWGLFPIYFHELSNVPALEILAHRITWSCLFLVVVVTGLRGWREVRSRLRAPGTLFRLTGSAISISLNWLVYLWAVNSGRVVEASLGYFVNPLVTVLLGVIFLSEKLTRRQRLAVGLAAAGVLAMVLRAGQVPWVALALALTFGVYGLIRKRVGVDALSGLLAEVGLLFPLAFGYLLFLGFTGSGHFGHAGRTSSLLAASGIVTAIPLLMFAAGVHRLALSTVGILQYINPTTQLALAVFALGEPFSPHQAFAFALIWVSLAVYSSEFISAARRGAESQNAHAR